MQFTIWQGLSSRKWFVQEGKTILANTSLVNTSFLNRTGIWTSLRTVNSFEVDNKNVDNKFESKEEALQALYDWAKTLSEEQFAEFVVCRMNGGITVDPSF